MPTSIEIIASNIMLDAYTTSGSFNKHPIGHGYEELEETEKFQVIDVLENYGTIKDPLLGSPIFCHYALNRNGMELHERHGSYLGFLNEQDQVEKDKELDRQLKQCTIESQKKTVKLAEEANKIAEEANRKAFCSNLIAFIALLVSIIAIILNILCK